MQKQMGISKSASSKLTNVFLLVAANVLATVNTVMAQANDPSVENIQKTTDAAKDLKEQIHHEEMMGYVYMVIGFGLVIAIAWFTNNKVQQRRSSEAAQKAAALQQHHGHRIDDQHRRTSIQRKRAVSKVN